MKNLKIFFNVTIALLVVVILLYVRNSTHLKQVSLDVVVEVTSENQDKGVVVVEVTSENPGFAISAQANKSECCITAEKYTLEILCPENTEVKDPEMCSCTDYMLCKLVMLTAFSSNHFRESQDFFGSVHAILPNTKIIVYDIGLTEAEVNRVQSYCNVLEVRKFNFDLYPPHVKELYKCAWKPLIVNEVSKEYSTVTLVVV